jgi:hypothetical protein
LAPIIAISGLRDSPKLGGSGVWQQGHTRMPLLPQQSGQYAIRTDLTQRPGGGANAGRIGSLKPVSRCRESSWLGLHPSRVAEPRPEHWNHSLAPSMR